VKFSNPGADVFVPDPAAAPEEALRRVTHLCVGAHQDDIEIMAQSGISDCFGAPGKAFGGVVAHPSSDVKRSGHPGVAADLSAIFSGCLPEVVFLHNPADKHDTHVAVLLRCLEAIRSLPADRRPARVLGCEVWRDLDWLLDADKVALDSGRDPELALKLLAVFDSQISGGKRYDLAAMGRRCANATFHTSHATDRLSGITWAVDLTPVTRDGGPSIRDFTAALVSRLGADVSQRLKTWG
jgi:LmbE family N-acetylglucosaminyl deacetylase